MNPIEKVYEQFKHLDKLISDITFLDGGDKIHSLCFELWQAIKSEMKRLKEKESK